MNNHQPVFLYTSLEKKHSKDVNNIFPVYYMHQKMGCLKSNILPQSRENTTKIKRENQGFVLLCLSGMSSIPALLKQPLNFRDNAVQIEEDITRQKQLLLKEPSMLIPAQLFILYE
jgi:hypothetical protein